MKSARKSAAGSISENNENNSMAAKWQKQRSMKNNRKRS
jgi:hypothetical protein